MSEQEKKVSQMTFDFGMNVDEADPSRSNPSVQEEDWEVIEEEFVFDDDPETETEMAEELRAGMDEESDDISASSLEMNEEEKTEVISKEEAAVVCAVCEEPQASPAPAAENVAEKAVEKPVKTVLKAHDLKRAALAFFASLGAGGIAKDVPTRGNRFRADAAAFFMDETVAGSGRKVSSLRTALAEVRTASEAKIECANHAQQLTMLNAARLEREVLEQEIRRSEPELRDDSNLFTEFEQWNYAASKNSAYKECVSKIRDLEYAIFHGSKLSKFHTAGIATELYLVVPDGAVCMESVADNWGVVFVRDDLSFELVKKPVRYDCAGENLGRMVRNIGLSACKEVLFANGVRETKDELGKSSFRVGRMPKKRRK